MEDNRSQRKFRTGTKREKAELRASKLNSKIIDPMVHMGSRYLPCIGPYVYRLLDVKAVDTMGGHIGKDSIAVASKGTKMISRPVDTGAVVEYVAPQTSAPQTSAPQTSEEPKSSTRRRSKRTQRIEMKDPSSIDASTPSEKFESKFSTAKVAPGSSAVKNGKDVTAGVSFTVRHDSAEKPYDGLLRSMIQSRGRASMLVGHLEPSRKSFNESH